MEKHFLFNCIWKGIKWMPSLIYWIWPNGIITSYVFGIVLSIFAWPVWIVSAVIVTIINLMSDKPR